ncbi:GDSL-type esterase/lipase family protein [Pseudomonas sp. ICMP 561]|uniref:GDSL-type esterase/lipase family protein n=1 Tax=Pseudomonas sp. ICMP 561 TaxID=1718918 RepID=UPI0019D02655|nr:GDSL-type esterase/lipase family protein [Pseudomonas sp. ICMP 561]
MRKKLACISMVLISVFLPTAAQAETNDKWVAAWLGAVQGPYPTGNPSAQPDLSLAFPAPEQGAQDQTFRLMVRPDIWGTHMRIRLSNVLGTRPVTFDGIYAGLQQGSSAVLKGTNQPVSFAGKPSVDIPAGSSAWSDPIALPFVKPDDVPLLNGRRLAVSFHIKGQSGPMTWHAKALNTSYVSEPGAGSVGQSESETAFPFSTTSTYFLDAVDMMAPADTKVVVAFGDSITDGTGTTLNGDDRWSDVLSRKLHAVHGNKVSVVNAGIGGNQVIGPASYSAQTPFSGGPSAQMRVERDVIGVSGVTSVIWMEGINDFSKNGNASAEAVKAGMKDVVGRIKSQLPDVKVIGGTLTTALGSTSAAHGHAEQNAKRQELNEFIRTSGLFDAVADFDAATLDPETGGMKKEYVADSTVGGTGDKLHPNRAGYQAMAEKVDISRLFKPEAN